MSSIYQRNGVWQIQYQRNGKHYQRSLKTTSDREARKQQRLIDEEIEREADLRAGFNDTGTVAELATAYTAYAEGYFRKAGEPTGHIHAVRQAMAALAQHGGMLTCDFGPLALRSVRDTWIAKGLARKTVNDYTAAVKAAFKWGASVERCSASVYQALATVEGLKAGRSAAKETEPVRPVLQSHIDAVRAIAPATIRAMIDLQLTTAARPGEILRLRPCDLDRSGPVWLAKVRGKSEHHGYGRTLYFGPRAQAVLKPFLLSRGPGEFMFSPKSAITERNVDATTRRRPHQWTPERKTARTVNDCYDTGSYRKAIARLCDDAEVPRWHPHQLRHNAATSLRKEFGLEAARLFLGHTSADMTQIYTDLDVAKIRDIAGGWG